MINYVKLWDVATGAMVWTSAEGDLGLVTSIVFSPDGTSIYCCDGSATTRIDARTGQTRQDLMKATDGPPGDGHPGGEKGLNSKRIISILLACRG